MAAVTPFAGLDSFIEALDSAVENTDPETITRELRATLCRLIQCADVRLPDCVFEPCPQHYARRELYTSSAHGYSVIAMTWGPGQGTLIHDHCGMWCVEGVWQGALEVIQYDLRENQGSRFRFVPVGAIQAGCGSAGSLIPPHEYHTIANPSKEDVAISVHVYSGAMKRCNVFTPVQDDWYRRCPRRLGLDN